MADLSDDNLDAVARGAPWNPKPLRADDRPEDYPIVRLPGVIGQAVREVADYVQAPVALVAASALSVVSAAVQTRFSMSRDARLRSPASLYLMTVAESGERKSTADAMFMAPIREWEARQRKEAESNEAAYRDALAAWEKADSADRGEKPERPEPTPKMLRGDDTPEALVRHLTNYPVAAVISAEAGVIFGSHAMNLDNVQRNLGQANQLWDGGPLMEGRIGRGEISIPSARVTMGLMLQPTVLQSFLQKTGGLARGIGFLARFLFCHPATTQGTRQYREPTAMPALAEFQQEVTELLKYHAVIDEFGNLETYHMPFDAKAQDCWIRFYNEVEEFIGGDDKYSGIKDVASKAAENAARLACCFQIFTSPTATMIGVNAIQDACALMRWYLAEAVRFGRRAEVTEELRNAELLETWLVEKHKEAMRQGRDPAITINTIRQKGPNALRGGKRVDDALSLLLDHHRVRVLPVAGSKSRVVHVAPQVVMEWS